MQCHLLYCFSAASPAQPNWLLFAGMALLQLQLLEL